MDVKSQYLSQIRRFNWIKSKVKEFLSYNDIQSEFQHLIFVSCEKNDYQTKADYTL